ncbi:MAG: MMPL family transporter [Alphaproteobacteria bacterium]|nr:MMPL family transporter [Alphaproteobacteria bacterium]
MSKRVSVIVGGFLLWIVVAATGLYGARGLQFDNDKWLSPDNPNEIARTMLASEFNQFESTMLLFKADKLFTEKGFQRAASFADAVKNIDGVVDVVSAYDASLIMTDEGGSLVITTYRRALENGQLKDLAALKTQFYKSEYLGRLLSEDGALGAFIIKHETGGAPVLRAEVVAQILATAAQNPLTADAEIAGDGYLKFTLDAKTQQQLGTILSIAAIGVALFLFSLFGRIWKTALVLGTAMTAVALAMGLMSVFGHNLTIIALALPVMLSVIVVADSLHIIRYWDNEIDTARDDTTVAHVLRETLEATWLPCLTTSATSAVGFGVFYFSELIPLREFGIDSFLGILLGYGIMMGGVFLGLYAATPGALLRRGGNKDKLSLPDRAADRFLKLDWSVVGNNRPATFAVAVVLTLASVTALFLNAKSESNLLDVFFKPGSDMYRAFDRVDNELGGSGVVSMVFQTDEEDYFRTYPPFKNILDVESGIENLRAINTTESYANPLGDIHRNLIDDGSQYPQNEEQLAQEMLFSEWSRSAESRDVLAENVNFTFDSNHVRAYTPNLSSTELEALVGKIEKQMALIDTQDLPPPVFTGHSVFFSQLSGYILNTQFTTVILTFVFIFIILTFEFNFRLAMAGMIACSLPILITMGTIAALGFPFDFATVIIASVTMGLSIDDTIHILHRYQHHLVDEHKSQRLSLRQALFIPGRPIVQSTFLFCFGAGVFLSSDMVMLQRFASFTMMGLVLALLGAVLLLPSLLSVSFFNKTSVAQARVSA